MRGRRGRASASSLRASSARWPPLLPTPARPPRRRRARISRWRSRRAARSSLVPPATERYAHAVNGRRTCVGLATASRWATPTRPTRGIDGAADACRLHARWLGAAMRSGSIAALPTRRALRQCSTAVHQLLRALRATEGLRGAAPLCAVTLVC
ncbi:hypothetical protein T492DRAFT_1054203 [Pavlovales sp. CCMP2436]|nr:hypothetical protein T492DRAFT_1054203 [Pavlovales sp. CCMP2436]